MLVRRSGRVIQRMRTDEMCFVVKRRFLRQNRELAKYVDIELGYSEDMSNATQDQLTAIDTHPQPRK